VFKYIMQLQVGRTIETVGTRWTENSHGGGEHCGCGRTANPRFIAYCSGCWS